MAEQTRPPIAVRIVRPYETEDAFLEGELETVGKTSVILIGAHARPQGVILRFEVTLTSGVTILRGEGRVLQHKENAFRGQAGLALRFTRLDPKSKALVDKAAAIREARLARDSGIPPAPPTPDPPSLRSVPPPLPPLETRRSVPPPLPPQETRRSVTPPPLPASARRPSIPPPLPPSASQPPSAPSRRSIPPLPPVADAQIAEMLTSPTPDAPVVRGESERRSVRPSGRPPHPASSGPAALAAMRAVLAEGAEDEPFQPVPPPPSDASLSAALPIEPEEIPIRAPSAIPAGLSPPPRPVAPRAPSAAPPAPPTPDYTEPAASMTTDRGPTLERPADRDGLLERLRSRGAGLSDDAKAEILRPR